MASLIECPVCHASHDASDPFCPKCGVAVSQAPAARTGNAVAATSAVPASPPTASAAPATNVLLLELQETLAPQIQVIKELGAGGMGTVFLGRDPALKRLVAIKVLNPDLASDESARLRFAREAEAAAAVAHPNVVSIFQVGALPRSKASYFVMQFIEGRTLSEAFPQGRPAPVPQARRIIGEVATALAAAHAKGLVHRDIKPANIMIDSETGRTIVLDFGISAVLQQRQRPSEPKLTATGSSIGTPTYMSPEQASAEEVTDKSDVYSLGVVAFELLTGRPPFVEPSSWALMAAHIKEPPPAVRDLAPNVDPELGGLIDTCLAKAPTDRPAATAIARYLLPGAQSILEWPPPGLDPLRGAGSRLVAALGIAVGIAWLFFATVLLQPSRTLACCWSQAPGGSLWDNLAGAVRAIVPVVLEDKDILPFWALVVVACVAAAPLLGIFVWRRAWRLADYARSARRSGYPWRVVLRVAWDRRPDTVSLINGVDAYALLPESARRRFLRLRGWEQGMLAAAVLAAAVMPLLWVAGLIPHGAPLPGAVLPSMESLLIVGPPLACLLAAALCARPEAGVRRRARADRRSARRRGAPVRPELVDAWLHAGNLQAPTKRGALPRPVVAITAVIGVLVVTLATALAVGATLLASYTVTGERDRLSKWNVASARSAWRELREAMAQSAVPAAVGVRHLNDVTALVPVAFLGARERKLLPWSADTALLNGYPVDSSGLGILNLDQAWRILPGRLPDSVAAALARDTLSPTLGLWRAFAYGPQPPPLWYFRPGLTGMQNPQNIFWWGWGNLRAPADRNFAAAALALSRGDVAGALTRVRENLAAGWRFYRDPGPSAWITGLLVLKDAIKDLETIGRATGDRSVTAEATRLRAAYNADRDAQGSDWWWEDAGGASLLFADPTNPAGLDEVADTTLAPSVRFYLVAHMNWGYCSSAREILFGIDPRRRELLAEAGRRLADIPRSNDWVEVNARQLNRLMAAPWSAWLYYKSSYESNGLLLAIPASAGLRGVAGRMSLCMEPLRR